MAAENHAMLLVLICIIVALLFRFYGGTATIFTLPVPVFRNEVLMPACFIYVWGLSIIDRMIAAKMSSQERVKTVPKKMNVFWGKQRRREERNEGKGFSWMYDELTSC